MAVCVFDISSILSIHISANIWSFNFSIIKEVIFCKWNYMLASIRWHHNIILFVNVSKVFTVIFTTSSWCIKYLKKIDIIQQNFYSLWVVLYPRLRLCLVCNALDFKNQMSFEICFFCQIHCGFLLAQYMIISVIVHPKSD